VTASHTFTPAVLRGAGAVAGVSRAPDGECAPAVWSLGRPVTPVRPSRDSAARVRQCCAGHAWTGTAITRDTSGCVGPELRNAHTTRRNLGALPHDARRLARPGARGRRCGRCVTAFDVVCACSTPPRSCPSTPRVAGAGRLLRRAAGSDLRANRTQWRRHDECK